MKHTDPVCGMQVDENTKYQSRYDGRTIYFCAPGCKEKFDRNPKAYEKTAGAR